MNETLLRFKRRGPISVLGQLVDLDLMNRTNSTEWLGREPESCKVVRFQQQEAVALAEETEFHFTISYRPRGTINAIEGEDPWLGLWSDGWKIKHINISRDGVLLDALGKPLPAGHEPVIVECSLYKTVDYNLFDYGELMV